MERSQHATGSPSGSLFSYSMGYLLSIALTLLSFALVYWHVRSGHIAPPHEVLTPLLIFSALAQLFIQIVFFLHLGRGSKLFWNLLVFSYALLMLVILVGGSLWIMQNLKHSPLDHMFIGGDVAPEMQVN